MLSAPYSLYNSFSLPFSSLSAIFNPSHRGQLAGALIKSLERELPSISLVLGAEKVDQDLYSFYSKYYNTKLSKEEETKKEKEVDDDLLNNTNNHSRHTHCGSTNHIENQSSNTTIPTAETKTQFTEEEKAQEMTENALNEAYIDMVLYSHPRCIL